METKRIYSLDLLKFIVIIGIIIPHFQVSTGISIIISKYSPGYILELLFITSGFLSMSWFSSAEKIETTCAKGFPSYLKHKCIRLYPMATLSTLFTVFCGFLFRLYFSHWFFDQVPSLWKLFKTLLLVNGGLFEQERIYNSVTWYMSVLLLCYSFQYFYVYLCKRTALKVEYFYIFMILFGIIGYTTNRIPCFALWSYRGYASFFIGCMIYKVYSTQNLKRQLLICSIMAFTICIMAGIINFNLFYDDDICQWGISTVVLWPSTFIIFLELNRFFKSPKWQILGSISFEMYLWHMSFIILHLIFRDLFPNFFQSEILQMILFFIFLIIISFVIFNFVEKPITKKLSKLFEIK